MTHPAVDLSPLRQADLLRPHAEQAYAAELAALAAVDDRPRPPRWRLSPWAVVTYLLGGDAGGQPVSAKYLGPRRLVEVAVATLATDRALLLLGVPGTAKTWRMPCATSASARIRPPGRGPGRTAAFTRRSRS